MPGKCPVGCPAAASLRTLLPCAMPRLRPCTFLPAAGSGFTTALALAPFPPLARCPAGPAFRLVQRAKVMLQVVEAARVWAFAVLQQPSEQRKEQRNTSVLTASVRSTASAGKMHARQACIRQAS